MGCAIAADSHRRSTLQHGRNLGKTVVDEVRHWTMNDMHSVVRQERNVTLCQKYVVSRQKPGTQRSPPTAETQPGAFYNSAGRS